VLRLACPEVDGRQKQVRVQNRHFGVRQTERQVLGIIFGAFGPKATVEVPKSLPESRRSILLRKSAN
jgi:hypothetical protein